jgi:hypothetical protein
LPNAVVNAGQRFVFYNGTVFNFTMTNFEPDILGYNVPALLHSTGTIVIFSDGSDWLIESINN